MAISSVLGSSALLPAGLGFRNLIINGAMQVNQRSNIGTAVTGITSSGYYTADRFRFGVSVGTWSQTTVTDAPAGFKNSLKLQVTSAASPTAGQVAYLTQAIEGQNCQGFAKGTSEAKPLVLSFWVKAFQTGTFICQITDYTNNRMICLPYTITASGTWEKKTLYIPADATGALANDSSGAFEVEFWLSAGSSSNSGTLQTTWGPVVTANQAVGQTNVASSTNNYWQITGLQLEQNIQPTPFEQRPAAIEEFLCKRYYQKWSNSSNTSFMTIGSSIYSTPLTLSSPMRAVNNTSVTYVATIYGNGTSYALNSLGVSIFDTANPQYFRLEGSFSGSWNYSWPLCTFNTHNVIINSEL